MGEVSIGLAATAVSTSCGLLLVNHLAATEIGEGHCCQVSLGGLLAGDVAIAVVQGGENGGLRGLHVLLAVIFWLYLWTTFIAVDLVFFIYFIEKNTKF